ncbi:MAG: NHL repeat-containing protein [Pirellulaceae bacterium]
MFRFPPRVLVPAVIAYFILAQDPILAQDAGQDSATQQVEKAAGSAAEKPEPPQLPYYPLDLAINGEGAVFVVDRNLHGIWKWQDEKLSIFVEGSAKFRTPLNAPRTVAFDQNGLLLVGDSATREIYRVSADGKPEPITGGAIGIPMDIAVKKDGTIYVADVELRTLFRIPPGESKPIKVAEVNPRGVFVDSKQQVWVVSQDPQQIQIVSDSGESQVIVEQRVFQFPHQLVVDATGTAFVTDGYQKAIWKIPAGGKPHVFFEGAPLDNPVGITLLDDKLVVVDPRTRTIYRFDENDKPQAWFEIKR